MAATVVVVIVVVMGLHSLLNRPEEYELQVLLRHNGRPASGHVQIRNAHGDVVRAKTIGKSGETTTYLEMGPYTVVSTDSDCVTSPQAVRLDNSPNAVRVPCRS